MLLGVFSQPTIVKTWLSKSGVYSSVIEEIAQQTKIEQAGQNTALLSSDDVAPLAKAAFTPESVQVGSEQAIDGVFSWLQGKTPEPEFKVDLSGPKTALVNGIATTLSDKAAALPACTGARTSVVQVDLTSLSCLPANADLAAARKQFADEFIKTSDFLPQNNLSAQDLKIKVNGTPQTLGAALPWVPKAYRALLWAPWVSLGLLIMCVVSIVSLSTKQRKGWSRVARGLVFSGVLLVVIGFVLVPGMNKLTILSGASSNRMTKNIVVPFLDQIWEHVARISLISGALYLSLGLVLVIVLFFTRRRGQRAEPELDASTRQPVGVTEQGQMSHEPFAQTAEYVPQTTSDAPATAVSPPLTQPFYQPQSPPRFNAPTRAAMSPPPDPAAKSQYRAPTSVMPQPEPSSRRIVQG